jgi:hypothetical protein
VEALAAIEQAHARTIPWDEAGKRSFDLILAASPKGDLRLLRGPRVLLPHGAGFGKTVRGEGSDDSASGLDPAYLLPEGHAVASFYALAHPNQVSRLEAVSPQAVTHAAVVGDPTLERVLASRSRRDHYRAVLGTGARKLIALTSTWGPESLLRRRPTLPAELVSRLPYDEYQLALIVHPNERSRIGDFELSERLAPALDAGMVLARPYEGWAAVLIAADAVVTDHGSAALYAAALDRPLIAAYDGGQELIPGSPMAELLNRIPRLDDLDGLDDVDRLDPLDRLEAALSAHRPGVVRALSELAFAEQGHALERLREELYGLLDLTPRDFAVRPRLLPAPTPPARTPAAFAVRTQLGGGQVHVDRFPDHAAVTGHHLAAEFGAASEQHVQSAGLLYCRADLPPAAPHSVTWTAAGWTAHILDSFPACRTAAAVLSSSLCVARTRAGSLLSVRITPCQDSGQIINTDPAAVFSAVHDWLPAHSDLPATVTCVIGGRAFPAHLSPATAEEAAHEL